MFMFFNFEQNFIEQFLRESGLSNFGHVNFSRNENSFFGRQFDTKHFLNFLIDLFADNMVVLGAYTYGASFLPKLWRKNTKKNEWVQVDPPTGVKSSFNTYVLTLPLIQKQNPQWT